MTSLDLNTIIDKFHNIFCEAAKKKVSLACFGYGCGIIPENLEELIEDRIQVEKELEEKRLGKTTCLTDEERSTFLGKIDKKLVNCGNVQSTLEVDDSNYLSWLNANPYCRVYESWEACGNRIQPAFKVQFRYEPVIQDYSLNLDRKSINLNLDLLSNKLNEDILMKISSSPILESVDINLISEKIQKDLVDLRLSRKLIYHELVSFVSGLVSEFHLDISSEISKNLIELQILIEKYNLNSELEIFISENKISSNLEIILQKINSIQDLDLSIELIEQGVLDIKMFKELLKSGCLLGFNPISIKTKRDVYNIRAIKCRDGE